MAISGPEFVRHCRMGATVVLYHYIKVYFLPERFLKYFPDTIPPTFYTEASEVLQDETSEPN